MHHDGGGTGHPLGAELTRGGTEAGEPFRRPMAFVLVGLAAGLAHW
jgi:hypothetical protein